MRRKNLNRVLSGVLAAALVAGSLILPGTGTTAEAAKKKKSSKKSNTATTTAQPAKPANPVTLQAAISGKDVVINAQAASVPATDDGVYHLYLQNIWENGTQGTELAQQPAGGAAQFTVPLKLNTADSLLMKKFTIVGVVGGAAKQLSNTAFITNPEAVADKTTARRDNGIKGILPDSAMIANGLGSVTSIGATEISYNLMTSFFVNGGGVSYQYNGKTYNYDRSWVGGYDELVKSCEKAGIQINMIVLCDPTLQGSAPQYVHPLSRGISSNYYMFNTGDAGAEAVEAFASFLGDRYPQVDNWIIGNEVNAVDLWNGFNNNQANDLAGFTKAYTDEFRVFYNGIKSHNANANVYVATDQEWQSDNPAIHYGVKNFLTEINRQIKEGGNISWGVSNHPYNYPLYDPNIASMDSKPQVTHDMNTSKYVTMKNVEILTDFMSQPDFLSPNGSVRPIVLSEVGYTSIGGNEALQAADIVYALNRAATNKYIDGIVINRQRSDAGEIGQGLDYGLLNPDGSQKMSYSFYTHCFEPDTIAQSSQILGIDINADCQKYAR